MTEHLGIVGDVHGDIARLSRVVEAAQSRIHRFVFVGDYVNRGRESAAVLDYLCDLAEDFSESVFLEGNHDAAFRSCLIDGSLPEFLQIGGAATVLSYMDRAPPDVITSLRSSVPERHLQFLSGLAREYRDSEVLVTHDRSGCEAGLGCDNLMHVTGHRPQRDRVPLISGLHADIDTGSGLWADGALTCLLWPSLEWVQG